jgi:hypothetical protein
MSDQLKLSVGQAHELEMAMNSAGEWTPELVKLLSRSEVLGQVRDFLNGYLELTSVEQLIDCNAQPEISNLADKVNPIINHVQGGIIRPEQVTRVCMVMRHEKQISCEEYMRRLQDSGHIVVNACAASYFMRPGNRKLLHEGRHVFFGTTFRYGAPFQDTPFSVSIRVERKEAAWFVQRHSMPMGMSDYAMVIKQT